MCLKRFLSVLLLLISLMACKEDKPTTERSEMDFLIGTYTGENSRGIYKATINVAGLLSAPLLAEESENPSFLARSSSGKLLYAVNENSSGQVSVFMNEADGLSTVNAVSIPGEHPCHISIHQDSLIIVSNYSSGNIALLGVNEHQDLILHDTLNFSGNSIHDRQQAPHAHSSYFLNDTTLITSDLGSDRLWINQIVKKDDTLRLQPVTSIAMEPGSGPRHLEFNAEQDRIYVMNELSNTISVLGKKEKENEFKLIQTISTLPEDFTGHSQGADLHLDQSGKFLYASNRGHQSLVIYEVAQSDGTLTVSGWEDIQGDWPRNFAITPDNQFLVVANERSGELVAFKRDTMTGKLSYTDRKKIASPVCILF
ncbi:lactonase family protein [Robertkochia marina]|uniref:Lactonase family protein n=1 Tax=Robertkochia marina TaxID=1227945 RepID=A0A4S3M0C5_9FLAO|nr:lactonase family protein [Robertkochia marina]THD67834.1 lactonase family protein [Robertkochia marina]TRZ42127.1 lactonase family protein [Robertkochia marina]